MTLDNYINEVLPLDYSEGVWDCVIFVARWADHVAGSKLTGKFTGSYSNKLEGLRKWGADTPRKVSVLAAVELAAAGWEVSHEAPEAGDLVALRNGEIGIAWQGKVVRGIAAAGLGISPASQIAIVWKWKGVAE